MKVMQEAINQIVEQSVTTVFTKSTSALHTVDHVRSCSTSILWYLASHLNFWPRAIICGAEVNPDRRNHHGRRLLSEVNQPFHCGASAPTRERASRLRNTPAVS